MTPLRVRRGEAFGDRRADLRRRRAMASDPFFSRSRSVSPSSSSMTATGSPSTTASS